MCPELPWYLTEDRISIALFNPDLEDEEKINLSRRLESYQQHSWRSESQHYLQFLPALRSLILYDNAPSSYSPSLRWTTNSFFKRTGKKQINIMLPEKLFQTFMATTFNGRITKIKTKLEHVVLKNLAFFFFFDFSLFFFFSFFFLPFF